MPKKVEKKNNHQIGDDFCIYLGMTKNTSNETGSHVFDSQDLSSQHPFHPSGMGEQTGKLSLTWSRTYGKKIFEIMVG